MSDIVKALEIALEVMPRTCKLMRVMSQCPRVYGKECDVCESCEHLRSEVESAFNSIPVLKWVRRGTQRYALVGSVTIWVEFRRKNKKWGWSTQRHAGYVDDLIIAKRAAESALKEEGVLFRKVSK